MHFDWAALAEYNLTGLVLLLIVLVASLTLTVRRIQRDVTSVRRKLRRRDDEDDE